MEILLKLRILLRKIVKNVDTNPAIDRTKVNIV